MVATKDKSEALRVECVSTASRITGNRSSLHWTNNTDYYSIQCVQLVQMFLFKFGKTQIQFDLYKLHFFITQIHFAILTNTMQSIAMECTRSRSVDCRSRVATESGELVTCFDCSWQSLAPDQSPSARFAIMIFHLILNRFSPNFHPISFFFSPKITCWQ